MKRVICTISIFMILMMTLLTFVSCGGDSPTNPGNPTIIGITVTGIETEYDYGQPLEISGITITVTYSDGTTVPITGITLEQLNEAGVTIEGYDPTNYGVEQTVTVSYGTFIKEFTVTVGDPESDSIIGFEIDVTEAKLVYKFGENLDTSGAVVTVLHYDDTLDVPQSGYTQEQYEGFGVEFIGYDPEQPGEQTVIVKYLGFTKEITVTVNEPLPTYTVLYYGNENTGGTAPVDELSPYEEGETVEVLDEGNLAKNGYTFTSWNTAANGSGNLYTPGATFVIEGDVKLYAQWIENGTVHFNKNSHDPAAAILNWPDDITTGLNPGDLVDEPDPAPSRDKFTFGGWFTEPECEAEYEWDFDTDTIGTALTLYAKWTYTITFNGNNAGGTGGAPDAITLMDNGHGTALPGNIGSPELAKTGYTFAGWNTEPVNYAEGDFYAARAAFTAAGDITLYAEWRRKVQFETNTTTPDALPDILVRDGETIDPPENTVTLTRINGAYSYTLEGWYTTKTFSPPSKWDFETAVTAEMTLYARWVSIVTYDANGGTGAPANATSTATAGSPMMAFTGQGDLAKAGCGFQGWAVANDATTALSSPYIPSGNITLYAVWKDVENVYTDAGLGADPTIEAQFTWLRSAGNMIAGRNYIVQAPTGLTGSLSSTTLNPGPSNPITIRLIGNGNGSTHVLSLTGTSSMFFIGNDITLILENNITLKGVSNTAALVSVNAGGKLEMLKGSVITGNSVTGFGSGVTVNNSGTFNMKGGEISGNTAGYGGGGVYVTGGTFNMEGGVIAKNTVTDASANNRGGGGVIILSGAFNKTGGTIYGIDGGDNANKTNVDKKGHAVFVYNSSASLSKFRDITAGPEVNLYSSYTTPLPGGGWNQSLVDVSTGAGLGANPTLDAQFGWLLTNAQSDTAYTVKANANESLAGITSLTSTTNGRNLIYAEKSNVTISLSGTGAPAKEISLSSAGFLINVGAGFTLNLGDNITLVGISSNNNSVVRVSGGTCNMYSGSKITGNAAIDVNGGGMYVNNGGIVTMNGSAIITGNSLSTPGQLVYYGAGVYVNNGTLTMNDSAEIRGNTNNSSNNGGVYVNNGTFTMNGNSIISENTSKGGGSGVYVGASGIFIMNDNAKITGNTNTYNVNAAGGNGGGVHVSGGTFIMNNGEISGNKCYYRGGGVCFVGAGATFTKTGGTINGSDGGANANTITSSTGSGHAVYINTPTKWRDLTAGPGVNLDKDTDDNWEM